MVKQDLTLSKILTREAFENAIRVNAGIGGSTNAVIILIALARRLNLELNLDDWDSLGREGAVPAEHHAAGQLPDGGLL